MFLKLLKYIRGYVKIRISGYSPERFLNLCSVHSITVWGVVHSGLSYEMFVSVRDYKRLRPLVHKTKVRIRILGKYGLPFFFHRFRKRKMFFAGIVVCTALIWLLSLFIWNIHIEGNVSHSTEEIVEYLKSTGVEHGILKNRISCTEIEKNMRNEFPEFLWVSAEMRGTRIVIQVRENTDRDIVSEIQEEMTDAMSIIADVSGTVDSMIVRQGTPAVSVGDQVEKGQILVEGYYPIVNDAKETIRYEGAYADADILIRCSETYREQISRKYEQGIDTGKSRWHIELKVEEKIISWKPEIPYRHYRMEEREFLLHLTENFYLPVSLRVIRYRECKIQKKEYTTEEAKEILNEKLRKKCEIILQKGVQIVEKDVRINTNGNFCVCSGTLTLLVPVQSRIPAEIPDVNVSQEEGDMET